MGSSGGLLIGVHLLAEYGAEDSSG